MVQNFHLKIEILLFNVFLFFKECNDELQLVLWRKLLTSVFALIHRLHFDLTRMEVDWKRL